MFKIIFYIWWIYFIFQCINIEPHAMWKRIFYNKFYNKNSNIGMDLIDKSLYQI